MLSRAPSTLGWQKHETRRRREQTRPTRAFRRTNDGPLTTNVQSFMKKEKLDGSGNLGAPLLPAATRWPLFGQQAHTFHRVKGSAAGQLLTRPYGEQKRQSGNQLFSYLASDLRTFVFAPSVYLSRGEFNSLPSISEVCSGTQTVGQASLKCG